MEPFTNQEQVLLLLRCVLLGTGAGLLYDVLRTVRYHFGCGPGATAVLDALFWGLLLCGLFEFHLLFAAGQNRFFAPVGMAGGCVLYLLTLSGAVRAALDLMIGTILQCVCAVGAAAQQLYDRTGLSRLPEKIRIFTKKFAKSSSIFRRKGIK